MGREPGRLPSPAFLVDQSKKLVADFRHRALRHHCEGIFLAETLFGITLKNSAGRIVPVRVIGEQHVVEDLGFIPTFEAWVRHIVPQPWMGRTPKLDAAGADIAKLPISGAEG